MPIMVQCPSCQRQLRVPDDLLGKSVRCPGCQTTFPAAASQPQGVQSAPPPTYQPPPPAYQPPPPSDAPWDQFSTRPVNAAQAKSLVNGPAIALMVVSGLTLGLAILSLIFNMAAPLLMEGNRGGGRPGDDVAFQAATGVLGAIIGLIWAGLIFAGAFNMMKLKNYGLAMTAAITAMVPCNLCCILSLPFGIWALVTLNKPEVKDAFT